MPSRAQASAEGLHQSKSNLELRYCSRIPHCVLSFYKIPLSTTTTRKSPSHKCCGAARFPRLLVPQNCDTHSIGASPFQMPTLAMLTLAMAEGTKKAGSIPFAYTIEALIKLKVLRVFVHPILDHTHDHLQTQTDGSPSGSPSSMVGPSLQGAEVSLVERGGATVIEVSSQVDSCEKQHLEIPLPDEVAVDGQSLSVIQRPDHLELKLRIVASLGEGNWGTQSSSSTELETIHGKGYFACGGCGQPVVEQGIK